MIRHVERPEWERDLELRQRNTIFPDTVENEGRFYRNILRTNMPLTPVQRAGVLILAIGSIAMSAGCFTSAISGFQEGSGSLYDISVAAIGVLGLVLGWMLAKRAFSRMPARPRNKKKV